MNDIMELMDRTSFAAEIIGSEFDSLFVGALYEVLVNIRDQRTDAGGKREIIMTTTFHPEDRDNVVIDFSVETKLASPMIRPMHRNVGFLQELVYSQRM